MLTKGGILFVIGCERENFFRGETKKIGFAGPFKCFLCDKAEETVDHLLLHYEFLTQC